MLGWISIRAAAKTAAFENPVVTGGGKSHSGKGSAYGLQPAHNGYYTIS
jgi:hypothetical protein